MTDLLSKSQPRTLYIRRDVLNTKEIISWAKKQGFKTTLPAEDLHVTVCFSRAKVDWMKMQEAWGNENGGVDVKPGGPRVVEPLGDKGAVVLLFASNELIWRHESLKRGGASSDYDTYQPHITITYEPGEVDLDKVESYQGAIKLGPEIFEEVNDDWTINLVEKGSVRIVKVDEELGLVFGWAIVCKVNGADYYDLNIDKREDGSYERVPEHIPEKAMLKAATRFMASTQRPGNEMHAGPDLGDYVFAFPMTTEIAKSLEIVTKITGMLVAFKPPPHVLAKYKDGTYGGFSIEGSTLPNGTKLEEVADG